MSIRYRPGDTIVCILEDCPAYRKSDKPMKCVDETETHQIFSCVVCERRRPIPKSIVGGTIGQGRRDDVPPKTLWSTGGLT